MKYFGLDGDNIGRQIESYLIQKDVEGLERFSKKIVDAIGKIKNEAEFRGARIIFCTGDSILFYGDIDISFGHEMLDIFQIKTGRTASVGIGEDTAKTYLGLKLAKAKGGGQVIDYK